MDGSRSRRRKDRARQAWYARHRQFRFARWMGFTGADGGPGSSEVPSEQGGRRGVPIVTGLPIPPSHQESS
jgi:hypothetical protein